MKTKAAILNSVGAKPPYATSKPLSIEEIDLDPPGPNEVLVKIAAAGLCHSDLSVINGDRPRPVPMALGHEAAGIVEELGAGVTDLKKGDHVVMVFMPSCGHCIPCAEGRPALCELGAAANTAGNLLSGQWRLHRGTQAINHHLGVSAFADHATVSRRSLVAVDPELPLTIAALFGCAVLTGVGAVVNTARVSPGSSVAIIGLGGVGLAALLGAAMAGASRIVVADLSKEKLSLATELGATDAFDASSSTAADEIRETTKGGVHYSFETAGSIKAMELAYRITRRGGTTVAVGLTPPGAMVSLPQVNIVAEERTIKGSYIGTCVPVRDIPSYIALYQRGKLPVDKLMSGRLGLNDINLGFDLLREGKAVRQVIEF